MSAAAAAVPRGPRRFMLALTGAATVWVVLELLWIATGRPASAVDYPARIEQAVRAHQPEGRNGWPILLEAGRRAVEIDKQVHEASVKDQIDYHPDYAFLRAVALDESAYPWEVEGLRRLREEGVLDLLAEAAACPSIVRPLDQEGLLTWFLLPEVSQFRGVAKARVGSMHVAGRRGDHNEVVRAFEDTLGIVRGCLSQAFLIDRLVGHAIHALVFDEVQYQLLELDLDEATLGAMLAALDRQMARVPPAEIAIESERSMYLEIVQDYFSDDGHGDGRLSVSRIAEAGWTIQWGGAGAGVIAPLAASRRETLGVLNEYFDGLLANSRLSPAARLAGAGFDENAFLAGLSFRYALLRATLPGAGRLLDNEDAFALHQAAMRIMLAIGAFRASKRACPATLEELVPDYLAAVPADPSCGKPFVFWRLASVAPGTWPYVLYSLGADGIDDTSGQDMGNLEAVETFGRAVSDDGYDVLLTQPRGELE